jgi:hypothetical protein
VSTKVSDHIGGLVAALCGGLGLDPGEVLELKVEPGTGTVAVTVLDAYKNIRCDQFHYNP